MSCEPLVYIENNTTTGLMETSSSDTASENSPTTSVTTNNLQISSDSFDIELNITTNSIDDGRIIDQSNCPSRRVSFPKCDSKLVTGYLEPANPWESALIVKNVSELTEIYRTSCQKHNTQPLEYILNHLQTLDLTKKSRHSSFSLKNHLLSPNDCETLEDIFKRIRYDVLDFSSCHLNEISSSALFDIIEYYEAATELDISDNPEISSRGWQSCNIMIRRSHYLQILTARGNPMSEINATSLGIALTTSSSLHTIKLERCGLKGKPISNLCNGLKKNSTLKELWLACNDLNEKDAENLAELLKYNGYIQFLDISNNNIKDAGLKHIVVALIEQSFNLDLFLPDDNKKIEEDFNIKSSGATTYPTNIQIPSPDEDYSNYLDNNSIGQNNKNNINGSNSSNCGGRSMLDTLLNNQQKSESDDSSNDTITQNTVLSSSFVINNSINSSVITGFSKNTQKKNNFIYSTEKLINKQQEQFNLKKETEISNLENIYNNINDDDTTTTTIISAHSLSKAVDVNKNKNNTTATDIFNPHSVDSAFESSSEGDKKSLLLINPEAISTNLIKSSTELEENIVTTTTAITTTTNTTKKLISPVQLSRLAYEKLTQFNEKTNDSDTISTTTSNDHLRSHSSDSLSSENSLDGCEATFSKDLRAQLAKNDTLTRQKTNIEHDISGNIKPRGLRALILWNNYITRESSEIISELLQKTSSLELLNIGKNCLSNEFIHKIKDKLKMNSTLTNLGLQSAHLSCDGVKSLASVLQFGGNCTLQRIDIRENHIQVDCLNILMDSLKSNKSVTRIDIDDVPKRISDPGSDLQFHYSRALHNIRSLCSRNEKNQQQILLDSLAANNKKCENPKLRQGYFNSRKISLTCQSITNPTNILETNQRTTSGSTTTGSNNKLDIKRKSGIRLRSPLPSPPTISPSTSPVPSPSKSRFQVFRVNEDNSFFPTSTANNKNNNKNYPTAMVQTTKNPLITATAARKSRFRVTKVENDQQTSLNYHSLDAANSINVKDISLKDDIAQNLLKSKSLPDFITTPTNLYVKNNENNEQKHQNIINNDNNDNCNINIKSQTIINDDNINNDMINFIGNLNSNNIIENSANLGEPIKIVSTINENNLSNNLVGDSSFNDKDINKQQQQQQQNQQLINNECDQCLENIVDNNKIINQNEEISICSPITNVDMHKNNNDKITYQINENIINKSEETSNKLEQEFQQQQQQQQNGKTSSTVSSTYPSTVDKLLSLFQNPGDIFSRVTNTTDSTTTESTTTAILEQNNQQSLVPLRKHSPPNLFSWYKFKGDTKNSSDIVTTIPPVITLTHQHQQQLISMDSIIPQQQQTTSTITDNTVSNNKQTSFFDVASKQFKDFADFGKQIFKQNVNFVKAANSSSSTSSVTTTTITTIAAIREPPINPPYFSTASCSVDPITTTTATVAVVVTATTEIPENSTATIATNNLDILNNIKSNINSNKENINEYMNKSDSEYCTTLKSSSSSSSLSLKSLQLICDFKNESMSYTTPSTNLINDKLLLPIKVITKPEHTINLNEKYIIIENSPILVATKNVSPEIDIVVCNNNNVVLSSDSIDSIVAVAATKNDKFISASITDNSSSDCVVTTTTASAAAAQNLKYEQQNFEFSDVNSSNGGGDGVVGSVSNINELILHQI